MKYVRDIILLQYPVEGTKLNEYGMVVRKDDAEKFVDLDSASGGYPYPTEIQNAHDFGTVKAAEEYRGHFEKFIVREVRVTYDFTHEKD